MAFLAGKKTFCIITGASRGIGAAIAQELGNQCGENSDFLLIARKENELRSICESVTNGATKVAHPIVMDLAEVDFSKYNNLMKQYNGKSYDQALLIHNAATIGPLGKKSSQLDDVKELRNYFDVNLHSAILLNSAFLQNFTEKLVASRIIINISSGAAYSGMQGMHIYAAAKAARDGFFRVVSIEEPTVRVLNFNPGPIITDMQKEVEREAWSHEIKEWSRDGAQSGTFQTADKAADVLVKVLNRNDYESGCFINIHEKYTVLRNVGNSDLSQTVILFQDFEF